MEKARKWLELKAKAATFISRILGDSLEFAPEQNMERGKGFANIFFFKTWVHSKQF
jgi:hypothetical protein